MTKIKLSEELSLLTNNAIDKLAGKQIAKSDTRRAMSHKDVMSLAFRQNAFSMKVNGGSEYEEVTKPFMEKNNLKWELDDRSSPSAGTIDLGEGDYEDVTDQQKKLPATTLNLGGKK